MLRHIHKQYSSNLFIIAACLSVVVPVIWTGCTQVSCDPGSTQSCFCPGGDPGQQVCDEYGAGYEECECNGGDDDVDPSDADRDGWTVGDGDCDDSDPNTYPGAAAGCDTQDANCDGRMDGEAPICGIHQLTMDDVVLVEGLVTSLSVGDLDNDGQDDIVVGRAGYPFDPGGYQPGSVAVVSGPVFGVLDLVSTSASALVVGNVDTSWLGNSVDAEGDLDGDGVVDLVAGAPGPSSGTGDGGGAAYIFFGPVTGDLDVEQADASFVGPSDQEALVGVVVSTGDINGDGSDDLLVGAGVSSSGEEDTMVYLFEGPIAGQLEPSDALARVKSSNLTDWGIWDTQLAIDAGGDVNGDGVDDLLIAMKTASPDFDGYLGGIGYLLFSPYSHEIEIETQAGMVVDGENGPTHMGYAVSLGDADGDQFADAIFGATEGVQDRGYGYFFPGSGAVGIGQITTDAVSITLEGADVGSCAGYQAVLGKDINGDGYGDLLIGALYTDGDPDAPGLTHLVLGKVTTSLDLSQADGTFIGPVGTHWNSIALASGDLDADGIDDIIMASDPEDQGDLSVSTISVVYGGS